MKANFQNIGPIKKAELELGDLTIIAGQNNTGKTYLVYTLYGFLNGLKNQELFTQSFYSRNIKKLAGQILSTGKANMNITKFKQLYNQALRRMSSFFSSEFINQVFSASKDEFENAHFSIETEFIDSAIESVAYSRQNKENRVSMKLYREDNNVVFDLNNPQNIQLPLAEIEQGIYLLFLESVQKNFPVPFILSAERFGISLFYKELDFTKNRLVETLQNLSDDKGKKGKGFDPFIFLDKVSARYAQPIKDNIDFTRGLPNIHRDKSTLTPDKKRSVETIVGGYYKIKNDEIRFISKKRKENRFDIPLHLASSSVRGLSDLYFYLHHFAGPGDLLIIDEPESHLSPGNQVLMARLLVFCVNSGLKVLITTHSDYLIKEINNLIMLHGEFEGKEDFLKQHKKDYTESDSLNPDSVRAYICEKGGLTRCTIDEIGIDMPVFDDAIDKINKISNELGLMRDPST